MCFLAAEMSRLLADSYRLIWESCAVTTPPDPEPPPEEPYEIPGTTAAWEPSTLPERPLTAAEAEALLAKDIA
jgi:hypothetical protein